MKRIASVWLGAGILVLFGANFGQSRQVPTARNGKPVSASRTGKTGFGKPQAITGTIVMTVPQQRLVVVAVRDSRLTADQLRGTHTTVTQAGQTVSQSETITSVGKTPTEAELSFEVNRGTSIKIAGERAAFADLAFLENKQATIRFVPYRDGNVARSIEVPR